MSVLGALVGGFAGTVVLTTVLRTATEVHLTRIDLPFLLGTIVTGNRTIAKAVGYGFHFVLGLAFALVYYGLFFVLGRHDWWLGAVFGLVHGAVSGTVLINVLLPLVHPRMGSAQSDASSTSLLEAPGFLGRNYGTQTASAGVVAHVLYGVIVAVFASGPL
jgi:hypothetical protein